MSLAKLDKIVGSVGGLIDKLEILKKKKKELEKQVLDLKNKFNKKKIEEDEYKKQLNLLLKGKKEIDFFSKYNEEINGILKKILNVNSKILELFEVKVSNEKEESVLDVKEIRAFLKRHEEKKKDVTKQKYTLYEKNIFGQMANQLFKEIGANLTKNYPELFKDLYKNLRISNMRVFSDTYVNIILLSGVLGFIFSLFVLIVFFTPGSAFGFIKHFLVAFLFSAFVLVVMYYWPKIVVDGRRKEIKNDLPFAIMHMAAVAGSGAPLVSVFEMILRGGEYKALNGEIKKIMNYVNLFGYNLSTALRSVSETTPSKEFKELLNGMRSTIETGGDLRVFLKNKATDTFTNYKNDRKRYVETLATYSDIYTAILIAAPLLFIIVLVLVSLVGNKLGGLDIDFIQKVGIYFVVPAFNVAFVIFLNIVQPEL